VGPNSLHRPVSICLEKLRERKDAMPYMKTSRLNNLCFSFVFYYFLYIVDFYRAMHFSVKHGLAIACRLSVCLSVCDVGGLWSHRLEFFENNFTVSFSVECSFATDPNIVDLLQREQPEIWAQSDPPPINLSVGDIRSQIAAEWLQIAQRSQWRAYRKPPSLFRMVPSLTPYDLPFPQMGFHMPTRYANEPYLCNGWTDTLHVWF